MNVEIEWRKMVACGGGEEFCKEVGATRRKLMEI
jgi:hypothetical protein